MVRMNSCAALPQFRGDALGAVAVPVEQGNGNTLLREQPRGGRADAAGAAGDEGGLAAESEVHVWRGGHGGLARLRTCTPGPSSAGCRLS